MMGSGNMSAEDKVWALLKAVGDMEGTATRMKEITAAEKGLVEDRTKNKANREENAANLADIKMREVAVTKREEEAIKTDNLIQWEAQLEARERAYTITGERQTKLQTDLEEKQETLDSLSTDLTAKDTKLLADIASHEEAKAVLEARTQTVEAERAEVLAKAEDTRNTAERKLVEADMAKTQYEDKLKKFNALAKE